MIKEITNNEIYIKLATSLTKPNLLDEHMNNDDFLDFSIIRCLKLDIKISIEKTKKQRLLLQGIKKIHDQQNAISPILQQKLIYYIALDATLEYAEIFTTLVELFTENEISELNYLWLQSNNTRQSLFIQSIISHVAAAPTNTQNDYNNDLCLSQFTPLRICSKNFKRPHDAIIEFKKFLLLTNGNIQSKINLINEIKTKWFFAENVNAIIPWLKKEKDRKNLIAWIIKREFIDSTLACEWLLDHKSGQTLKSFISYFDILTAFTPDKATLTAMRLKKSWSQFKTREKNKESVQFNFILPPSIKNLLKDVCDTTGISRNAFVEMAIKNEYKRFQDTTKKGS